MLRRILLASSVVLCAALAGCGGSGGGNPDPGVLNGIYVSLQHSSATGIYTEFITFFPDGRVYYDYPKTGTPLDWTLACEDTACGQYRVSGDELQLDWDSGTQNVWTMDADGVLFNDRDPLASGYRRLEKFDGVKLEGRYEARSVWNGETFWIAFQPNGGFTEENLSEALLFPHEFQEALSSGNAVEGGSGTWSLRDNTVELRYEQGLTLRWGIHVAAGETPRAGSASLVIGRAEMIRAGTAP